MDHQGVLHALLGLDIGFINTRASYFGILEEKFKLEAFGRASSSLGKDFQLGSGAGAAMQDLQSRSDVHILKPNGELIWPFYETGLGVDRIAVTISGGPKLRTVLLGLTDSGSLKAGHALVESMPLALVASYNLTALSNEAELVDALVSQHPELVILVGGENGGDERHLRTWIDILKLVLRILPDENKPDVLYAGNVLLEERVKRHLEPLADLTVVPNIRPNQDEMDLVPAQAAVEKIVVKRYQKSIPGFKALITKSKSIAGTKSFALSRMIRYLGKANAKTRKGVLAIDLSGGSTMLGAGLNEDHGVLIQPAWDGLPGSIDIGMIDFVHQWTAASVTRKDVSEFLCNHALLPNFVPEDIDGLAILQAYTRYRIRQTAHCFAKNFSWFPYKQKKGLAGSFEPVIASGSILTQAPSDGQTMLMLIDGLESWGVTTIVLDRYQILPMLGLVGTQEPVLPVQVLGSDAFENLGTVIVPVSSAPEDEVILNVKVKMDGGKDYDVEVLQGSLRRLVIPSDVTAELSLEPMIGTDVGFGGQGVGGRLKIPGGSMGVVIDARGRPLRLPEDDEKRIEELKRWQVVLGG